MSITFPTFIDKEIVTPEKLNDFVQALEAKFAAGISSAEISWPMYAGGNLFMEEYEIPTGKSIWGIYNAANYADDWDTCLSDGASGCIVIPPDTTVTMDGSSMTGSSLTIRGSGPSSVLQLEAGATSGHALKNSTAGFSLNLSNLTLDGADIGSNRGIILDGADGVVIDKVYFTDFPLSSIQMINGCANVRITNNRFEGGASYQIEGADVRDLVISGNMFYTAAKTAIELTAADATADILRVDIGDNIFRGCTGDVISILGGNGSFNVFQSNVNVHDNVANDSNGIVVGSVTKKVQHVSIANNVMPSSAGNGLTVCAQYGAINGNVMPNATDFGLDLLESYYMLVSENQFQNSTTAVTFVDARGCSIHDNDCGTAGTLSVATNVTTPCHHHGNVFTPESGDVQTYFCDAASFIMPANTLQVGDTVDVVGIWTDGGAGTQGIRVGATTYAISHTSSGAAAQVIASVKIYVSDATTLKMISNIQTDNSTINSGGPDYTGYDLSSGIKFKINGATISGERMVVTIGRGIAVP